VESYNTSQSSLCIDSLDISGTKKSTIKTEQSDKLVGSQYSFNKMHEVKEK